ncbi:hypothetical protein BDZ45DRAFT_724611 [Acephala macrosclerotiorum]|nr:hypothetical protein BDZ45DRAFT_724611 [Acephala macrosclerotiorum]
MPPKRDFSKINTDPTKNASKLATGVKDSRRVRYQELGIPYTDIPALYSPDWPVSDPSRDPYPFMPPPARMTGKANTYRTCEVCGRHVRTDGDYYEHMKRWHPWAPRSYQHGRFREPVVRQPDLTQADQKLEREHRTPNANLLAADLGFNENNKDGPAQFRNLTEEQKQRFFYLWNVVDASIVAPGTTGLYELPEKSDPPKFRVGRIIAPTYKNGELLPRYSKEPAYRRAFTAEFWQHPELLQTFNMVIGDFVLYLDDPDTPYAFFRGISPGYSGHIPWRMIQPIDLPWGLPEDVKYDSDKGVGLPITTCSAEDIKTVAVANGTKLAMSNSPENWSMKDCEVLLRLDSDEVVENIRIMDYERRRGAARAEHLASPPGTYAPFPWGVKVDRDWLSNHIRSLKEGSYTSTSASTPSELTRFHLGRIIAPTSKQGAIALTESNEVSKESLIQVTTHTSPVSDPSKRFNVGDLVLYLTEDPNNPKPMFRDVLGNEQHIPLRQIQRLYLPFGIPEDISIVQYGIKLPIAYPTTSFTVTEGLGVDRSPRNWDVRQNELLLLTAPPGSAKTTIVDYERRYGTAPADAPDPSVTLFRNFPWNVAIDIAWLDRFLKTWNGVATAPLKPVSPKIKPEPKSPSQITAPAKQATSKPTSTSPKIRPEPGQITPPTAPPVAPQAAQNATQIPLLTKEQFQNFYATLQGMPSTDPFVTSTIKILRSYIEKHVDLLVAVHIVVETQAMANWRPAFWGPMYDLLVASPKFTDPVNMPAMAELTYTADILRGTVKPKAAAN